MILSTNLYGQTTWTLEECLEYAADHNIQILQSEIDIRKKQVDVTQSNLNYIPEIALSADRNYSWGRSVDMQELVVIKNKLNSSMSLAASTSIPIIDGFNKVFTSKISRAELTVSGYEKQSVQEDIQLQIIRAYLELLLSKELYGITQLQYDEISLQYENSKSLVALGKQPQSAIMEMSSRLSESKVRMIDAKWQVESKKYALEQLLDLTLGAIEDIPDYEYEEIILHEQSILNDIDYDSINSPIIHIANEKYKLARLYHRQSKAGLLPVIGISLGYMTYFGSTSEEKITEQLKTNINPTIGISLQFPLFKIYNSYSRVRKAKLDISYAAMERQKVQLEIQNRINEAVMMASRYYESRNALKDGVKSAEETYHAIENKYENGAATALDMIIAHNAVTSAKSQLVQASLQYIFQLKIIDCYCGNKISL